MNHKKYFSYKKKRIYFREKESKKVPFFNQPRPKKQISFAMKRAEIDQSSWLSQNCSWRQSNNEGTTLPSRSDDLTSGERWAIS